MNYHTNIILPSPIFIIPWKIISGQKSATTKTIRNFVIETTGDLIDEKEISHTYRRRDERRKRYLHIPGFGWSLGKISGGRCCNARRISGHFGLAALEKDFDVRIITQNIDNLHERAGSSKIIHLHGELMKACPVNDLNTTYDISPERPEIHLGDKDSHGNQLRPFIVWFGEPVPMIDPAIKEVESCDIFVIIGTSLNVYPAAGLLNYVRRRQPIFLIDPKEVKTYRNDIEFIRYGASEGVKILSEKLKAYKDS